MGVNSSDKIIHSAKNVTIQTLSNCLMIDRKSLSLDIDISRAVFKVASGKDDERAIKAIANLLSTLANYGYHNTPICDAIERHRSKCASMNRIQKSKLKRICGMALWLEASKISQQLSRADNVKDTHTLKQELAKKNKEIRSYKNGSSIRVSKNFALKSHARLLENDYYDPSKYVGSIKKVFIAKFQADS